MAVHVGSIKGAFRGFRDRNTFFEFDDGSKWRQAAYHYSYYYAYAPRATVTRKNGRDVLEVEGMNDSTEVERVR